MLGVDGRTAMTMKWCVGEKTADDLQVQETVSSCIAVMRGDPVQTLLMSEPSGRECLYAIREFNSYIMGAVCVVRSFTLVLSSEYHLRHPFREVETRF